MLDIDHPTDTSLLARLANLLAETIILAGVLLNIVIFYRLRRNPPDWKSISTRFQSSPWSALDASIAVVLLISFWLIFAQFMALLQSWLDLSSPHCANIMTVLQTLALPVLTLVIISILVANKKISWQRAFGWRPEKTRQSIKTALILLFAGIPLVVLIASLMKLVLVNCGLEYEQHHILEVMSDSRPVWLRVFLVMIAVVIAPASEELLFRGIGFSFCAKQSGRPFRAMILVSLLFACVHLDIFAVVPLFVISMLFSVGYLYSNSILVPIAMHSLFNGIQLFFFYVMTSALHE